MKTKASNLSEDKAQKEYRKLIEKEIASIEKRNKEQLETAKEEYLLK